MSKNKNVVKSSSVSALLDQVKYIINKNFDFVIVTGEISNFSKSSQGHFYLSLSDKRSLINTVIFRGDAVRIPQIKNLKDGELVEVIAELNVYERRGQVQLIVKKLRLVGEGDLKARFEQLKRELSAEGLFDVGRKKNIPKYPSEVAVISAQGSAALEDFVKIHNRRSISCNLTIIPSIMQGENSSKSVLTSLKKALKFKGKSFFDCIVICRGGGSFEDLNSFNDEELAREVSALTVPVISAIGHQVDYTILDYVADLRAETPSAAAELLSENEWQLQNKLNHHKVLLESKLQKFSLSLSNRLSFIKPHNLQNIIFKRTRAYQIKLDSMTLFNRPETALGVYNYRQRVDEASFQLKNHVSNYISQISNRLHRAHDLTNALNPNQVLERGYAIIRNNDDQILTSCENLNTNSEIKITQHDGDTYAKIL